MKDVLINFLILFSLVNLSCHKKESTSLPKAGVVSSSTPISIKPIPHKSIIDPNSLKIKNINVSFQPVGKNKYPHINFDLDKERDFVKYELCSSLSCKEGDSTITPIVVYKLVNGTYSINLSPCIYKYRNKSKENSCGQKQEVKGEFLQEQQDSSLQKLLVLKEEQQQAIKKKMAPFFQDLTSYNQKLKECKKKHPDIRPILNETVMNNLMIQGPNYVGEVLSLMNVVEKDSPASAPSSSIAEESGGGFNLFTFLIGISGGLISMAWGVDMYSGTKDLKDPIFGPKKGSSTASAAISRRRFTKIRGRKMQYKHSRRGAAITIGTLGAITLAFTIGCASKGSCLVEDKNIPIDTRCQANQDFYNSLSKLNSQLIIHKLSIAQFDEEIEKHLQNN